MVSSPRSAARASPLHLFPIASQCTAAQQGKKGVHVRETAAGRRRRATAAALPRTLRTCAPPCSHTAAPAVSRPRPCGTGREGGRSGKERKEREEIREKRERKKRDRPCKWRELPFLPFLPRLSLSAAHLIHTTNEAHAPLLTVAWPRTLPLARHPQSSLWWWDRLALCLARRACCAALQLFRAVPIVCGVCVVCVWCVW